MAVARILRADRGGTPVPSQIHSETRYNDLEKVYVHKIEEELADYYLNLNRPLPKGNGRRYYDQKPETRYFHTPVVVQGDVKVVLFSFAKLARQQELSFGFNTLQLRGSGTFRVGEVDFDEHRPDRPQVTVSVTVR